MGPGPQASHQQRASHQTVHILFLANNRCLRDYETIRLSCRALLIIVLVLDNSFVDELCHFDMFADIFKDDEPGDTSIELFLYKLIIQQAPTDICLLVPPHLEK